MTTPVVIVMRAFHAVQLLPLDLAQPHQRPLGKLLEMLTTFSVNGKTRFTSVRHQLCTI